MDQKEMPGPSDWENNHALDRWCTQHSRRLKKSNSDWLFATLVSDCSQRPLPEQLTFQYLLFHKSQGKLKRLSATAPAHCIPASCLGSSDGFYQKARRDRNNFAFRTCCLPILINLSLSLMKHRQQNQDGMWEKEVHKSILNVSVLCCKIQTTCTFSLSICTILCKVSIQQ